MAGLISPESLGKEHTNKRFRKPLNLEEFLGNPDLKRVIYLYLGIEEGSEANERS
jgi:hypothetical protein